MPQDSKIILFGERIASAKRIFAALEGTLPGQAALYHSGMDQEAMRAALARYQAGEARILITCRALDEGLDIPETAWWLPLVPNGSGCSALGGCCEKAALHCPQSYIIFI